MGQKQKSHEIKAIKSYPIDGIRLSYKNREGVNFLVAFLLIEELILICWKIHSSVCLNIYCQTLG